MILPGLSGSALITLPIVIPFIVAALTLPLRKSLLAQRILSGISTHAILALAFAILHLVRSEGIQVHRMGDWFRAYGIVLTVDLFAAIMLCVAAVTQTAAFWYTVAGATPRPQEVFYFHPVFLLMTAGVHWAFSTGDLFNLFVSFEIMLLASYVLVVHGNSRGQVREGLKYLVMNALTSTVFLIGAGFIYGTFGTLNMAELAVRLSTYENHGLSLALGTMLIFVFGVKAALFPLFFWLPNSYPHVPLGVLPYFAGILTKVGVYCLFRTTTLLWRPDIAEYHDWLQPLLLAISGATMLFGVLGAVSQWTMRRILSFHIISQIGYMIFGLGLFTPFALAAAIFYIVHHILVKSTLFMVAGSVAVNEGTDALKQVHGLVSQYPALAVFFLLAAFSLAGLPPLSGFFGKYALVIEGMDQDAAFYVAISLVTSLFTIMSMVKIWRYSFWGEPRADTSPRPRRRGIVAATGLLATVSVVIVFASGWLFQLTAEAANQLIDQRHYVRAVLGEEGVAALRPRSAAQVEAAPDKVVMGVPQP